MNLLVRSVLVLGILFGLLFAAAMGVLAYYHLPLVWGVGIALGVVLLQYLLGPFFIQLMFRIRWASPQELAPGVASYLYGACSEAGVPVPRIGLIDDGNPNAFTFGHYPRDARLVLTTGLTGMLDEEEQKAVVGHELGHIAHWDFAVMTLAAVVPMVLYMIYRFTLRSGRRSSREGGGYAVAVGIIAFVAYIVSEYIVLFLSRVREYYADQFSGDSTRNPNALASGLVKIAYGLARAPREAKQGERRGAFGGAELGRSLGIFDPRAAGRLALAAAGATTSTGVSATAMVDAMKWDLWNPWAAWYELGSTHPLPAKRIRALERLAVTHGQPELFDFPYQQPESYWDEFLVDWLTHVLPWIGAAVGGAVGALLWSVHIGGPMLIAGCAVLGLSLGGLVKVFRSHPTAAFPPATVERLVGEVKVSGIRSIPCTLDGRIIGRGVPGLYWSEDLVLQDESGFIVLDYRQPLRILEILFGLFRARNLVGGAARAVGWFRRAPVPFLELLYVDIEGAGRQRSWFYTASLALAVIGVIAGLGLAGIGLML